MNSINWARVVAQVVYYFKGLFCRHANNDEHVSFGVPSGNFGNVCAGHIARMMGLPIQTDCRHQRKRRARRVFRTGVYKVRGSATPGKPPARRWTSPRPQLRALYFRSGRPRRRTSARAVASVVDSTGEFDLSPPARCFARNAEYGFASAEAPTPTAWPPSATPSSNTA